ncbi:LPS export ABC transporter periplasmic protein LptC [Pseudothauera rhizosphaerae]|uniref:LPS export ABC transporter periplasmic protein LptC n=1 Tax=Pseudothauera rhizosphaerae TaxID=2565932 RepID=A0A4S4APT9_9RHOO|nr:LPS export ABC transporter periplasmic protein LptC [Pseudothauera rhizosphaerae]THF61724.1 LPS export ABC transporter periplasmic protein LptC [Pseudothauera rhizosphaerae]
MAIPAHRIYPVVALALLAGATLWLERVSAPEEARTPVVERGKADFSADGTRLVSFGADGRQRYELLAERITHYPGANGTDITEFTRPRLTQTAEGRLLHLVADSGEAYREGEEILFTGKVRVRRSGIPGEPEAVFVSDTLTVWPDDERARSRTPVVLTRGDTVIRASGMQADNIFGTLQFDGRVNATMPRSGRNTP